MTHIKTSLPALLMIVAALSCRSQPAAGEGVQYYLSTRFTSYWDYRQFNIGGGMVIDGRLGIGAAAGYTPPRADMFSAHAFGGSVDMAYYIRQFDKFRSNVFVTAGGDLLIRRTRYAQLFSIQPGYLTTITHELYGSLGVGYSLRLADPLLLILSVCYVHPVYRNSRAWFEDVNGHAVEYSMETYYRTDTDKKLVPLATRLGLMLTLK